MKGPVPGGCRRHTNRSKMQYWPLRAACNVLGNTEMYTQNII